MISLDEFIEKWYLWLPLLLYLVFKDRWGETTIYVSTQWIFMYYLILIIVWALNEQGKYNSPMLVANNEHMCVKQAIIAGDWAIFTDFIDAPEYFMTYPINSKTVVVPKDSVYKVGQNYFSISRVVRKDFDELPYSAQQVIFTNKMSDENIYFGQFSETFERTYEDEAKKAKSKDTLDLIKNEIDIYRGLSSKNRQASKANLQDLEHWKGSLDRLTPKDQTLFESLMADNSPPEEPKKKV